MESAFVISRRQLLSLGASALAVAGLAACNNGGGNDTGGGDAPATDPNDVKSLTSVPGKLTVATGNPAWEPWVMNDAPESGEGFEAALIYALADKMGFAAEDVAWVRTTFEEAYAPGQHDWDLNIQQVSINDDRKKAIDFSPAYFRPTQSIIVKADSAYANATSCADFADAVVGVMMGTTALDYVKDILGVEPEVYNDNSDAAAAVSSGQADALVTDTPQCVYMVESDQVENSVVVGQIPGTEDPEGLGITLAKDSPLTPFVTEAMDAILEDGTVQGLVDQWLAAYTSDIPVLTE
ncbi:amino acid ABC transporter substrate-binding protein [Coriobacteriales bacterium OH1046]|nr:amino acid ABC transporter substrate-binding protein [Coriobacteriales bacterium OH1046]